MQNAINLTFCEHLLLVPVLRAMMSYPWRGFILLLSQAVKASSLGRWQPRLWDGKGSEKQISLKMITRKKQKNMQQTRKDNRPKQFHAALPRPQRCLGLNSKDQRCGRETYRASTIVAFLPILLPSNVCHSQWELTALQRLIWQPHLFPFHYRTPLMLKASVKANSKSDSDMALKGWQLNFSYERTTVGCLSTHTSKQVENPAWEKLSANKC